MIQCAIAVVIGKRSPSFSSVKVLLAKSTVMETVSGYLAGQVIFRSDIPEHDTDIMGDACAAIEAVRTRVKADDLIACICNTVHVHICVGGSG